MNYQLIKDIYQFMKENDIKSFHAVGYGISPSVSLIEIQSRKKEIKPEHQIILNTAFSSYTKEKLVIQKRFPDVEIVLDYYDSNCFVNL
jgi:hypothetical protein